MFELNKKKVALVTGGGSGIGKAVALTFAKQGATVHVLDVNPENAGTTIEEIKGAGGEAAVHTCDVTNQQEVVQVQTRKRNWQKSKAGFRWKTE